MKRTAILLALAALLLLVLSPSTMLRTSVAEGLASIALADPGSGDSALRLVSLSNHSAGYDLSWWTVDGGGATVGQDGILPYTLGSTIGQPDAGVLTGGDYRLGGGFWVGVTAPQHHIYLPLVLR